MKTFSLLHATCSKLILNKIRDITCLGHQTLCNENKSKSGMIKFLHSLTKTKLGSKNDAEIYLLGECIHTLVTKDKSQLKSGLSLLLHGFTRSKKLINVASDLGIGTPYHNVLYLHECWALGEFERQLVWPPEIAEGKA